MDLSNKKCDMLYNLRLVCKSCVMCELGFNEIDGRNDEKLNPHVFSDYVGVPSEVMVVGQNPGYNELIEDRPFVGAAGKNFENAIRKNGCKRSDFYICNMVRCYTDKNSPPTKDQVKKCEPYFRMELAIIKPKMVVVLGSVAFAAFGCGESFQEAIGKLIFSEKFNVHVFTTYHPSPLNLNVVERREQFDKDISIICGVVKNFSAPF